MNLNSNPATLYQNGFGQEVTFPETVITFLIYRTGRDSFLDPCRVALQINSNAV